MKNGANRTINPIEWLAVFREEGGSTKAALEAHLSGNQSTGNLRPFGVKLIQVMAVAVALVECLDHGKWK